jgi:nucleoid-associated protein YgaU
MTLPDAPEGATTDVSSAKAGRKKSALPFVFVSVAALATLGGYFFAAQNEVGLTSEPVEKVAVAPVTPETKSDTKPVAKAETKPAPVAPKATNGVVPSFDTVRVEKDGAAVIAGRAEPGTQVTAMLDGKVIGKAETNSVGEFVVVPDELLPEGTGSISLLVQKDGKDVRSDQQVAVVVKPKAANNETVVAMIAPDQPTKLVPSTKPSEKPSDLVKVDTVDYDANGNIIFSGRASPGNTVRIYVDNTALGEVKVGSDGKWLFDQSPKVSAGNHTLRADEIDGKGTVVSRVELPLLREDKNKVAELQQATPVDADGDTRFPMGPERIVIQPGNSLWRVSRVIYGKGIKYTLIYEANRDQIRDANKIYPGQIFAAPKL